MPDVRCACAPRASEPAVLAASSRSRERRSSLTFSSSVSVLPRSHWLAHSSCGTCTPPIAALVVPTASSASHSFRGHGRVGLPQPILLRVPCPSSSLPHPSTHRGSSGRPVRCLHLGSRNRHPSSPLHVLASSSSPGPSSPAHLTRRCSGLATLAAERQRYTDSAPPFLP